MQVYPITRTRKGNLYRQIFSKDNAAYNMNEIVESLESRCLLLLNVNK